MIVLNRIPSMVNLTGRIFSNSILELITVPPVQCRHSIPATVERTSCQCLVLKTPQDNYSKNKRSTPMSHIGFETKLPSVVKSHMHPCQGNCVAIGSAVVNYAQAAHSFSAGIKCRHCILQTVERYIRDSSGCKHWETSLYNLYLCI